MGEILVLGASNAVPSKDQENSHLLVRTDQQDDFDRLWK
jgi:hypothetical protein